MFLVNKHDHLEQLSDDWGSKTAFKNFLMRLLGHPGMLQKFMDALFQTIFSITGAQPCCWPFEYMFDLLDRWCRSHQMHDADMHYTWKKKLPAPVPLVEHDQEPTGPIQHLQEQQH